MTLHAPGHPELLTNVGILLGTRRGARDAYHRDTESTEATWTCARLRVIPFSREDAKTRRETMSGVHRVFPFAASRLRVSPSLKGIIKELSVISVSPWSPWLV